MAERSLIVVTVIAGAVALLAALRPPARAPQPVEAASSLPVRGIVQFVSREVLPDVVIDSVNITETQPFGATFTYRIRNVGDDAADLTRFTLQAWFSPDAALDKATDVPAGIFGFTQPLEPLAALELSATATGGDADVIRYPYLILELNSAGTVHESSTANNVRAVLRPPLDLVGAVDLAWDQATSRATVTWAFNGAAYGVPDLGFRIEAPGFGTQVTPPGTRSVTIRFNPVTGERPCIAKVAAIRDATTTWPAVTSNRLCQ